MGHAVSTDVELIDASVAGRVEAFTALVERYQSLVCAVSYSATGDRALSEDIAQETFVAAWNGLSDLREPSKLRGWLCGIARNLSSKALRRVGREIPGDAEVQAAINKMLAAPSPLDDALEKESEQLVWTALLNVPETYREPLVLFYREDQSTKQVAEALGLSENAVQQRLSRGRQHLKARVIGLVERTLERTKPSKGFAAGVVAVISAGAAGTAEGAASQARSSTSSSVGGPSAFAKGPLTMKILKIALVAAVMALLVFAGSSLVGQASERSPNDSRVPTEQVSAITSPGSDSPKAGFASRPITHSKGNTARATAPSLAPGDSARRPEKTGIMFSIAFSDADKKHSRELRDVIMPKIGETLDILAGCYDAFLVRNPSLRDTAGQVTVDVALAKDDALGGIAVGTEHRAHVGAKTDAGFAECISESSFALDYDAGEGQPEQGTVRITMEFPDASQSGQDRQAATRACFEVTVQPSKEFDHLDHLGD